MIGKAEAADAPQRVVLDMIVTFHAILWEEVVAYSEVISLIEASLNEILRAKGAGAIRVAPETRLIDGGIPIDSLDLAQLLLELQNGTGKDPFANGFINFESVDELSRLFSC